jgi:3D (Asp-Asp-Asp) domain-containing protein
MLLLSRSLRRKLLATLIAATGFLLVYQATVIDSRGAPLAAAGAPAKPTVGARVGFVATAYCKGQTTASGVSVQAGIAAADEDILPEGSVVEVDGVPEHYRGIYTVMDTGPKVTGRHVDLYMWSCYEALDFGRRDVQLTVLRLGWNPKNSASRVGGK